MKSPKLNLNTAILGFLAVLLIAVGVQSFFLVKLYGETRNEGKSDATEVLPLPSSEDQSLNSIPNSALPSNPFDDDFFSGFGDDWHPFKEMERMREQMDQMFGQSMGRFQQLPGFDKDWLSSSFAPEVDIQENDEAYVVTMDVPGTDKSNIDVSWEDGVLTLKGSRKEITEEKEGDQVFRSERRQGTFQRSFSLPGPVDAASMKIDYDKGVLKVSIDKAN